MQKIMKRTKNLFLILTLLTLASSMASRSAEARQGFAIGMGPVGNIFLVDTIPIIDPGIGGPMFFNYRFAEQLAFQTGFMLTSQDGTNVSNGDNGILFLGMPTVDLKYYFLKNDPKFDPYISTGLGLYWLTEGSRGDSTGGLGMGAQIGVGFDFYIADAVSLGFDGVFRSIGLITNLSTPSASTAIFPYSLMGNVAFHF